MIRKHGAFHVMRKKSSGLSSGDSRKGVITDGRDIKSADDALNFFEHASDSEVDAFLMHLQQQDIGERENDNDVQRFMNQIGWTADKPEVLSELQYQQAWQAAGAPAQLYHSDKNNYAIDAREFAKQFFGIATNFAGDEYRHYISNGYYGGGTYFADSASESAGYGTSQFRGFLNSNARPITISNLIQQQTAYEASHPAFARFIRNVRTGYGDEAEARSIFAAMKGYNVIDNEWGYKVVLNRSAMTTSRKTKKTSWTMKDW